MVDEVFVEESLEKKRDYIVEHGADVLVMGDDWAGKFDWVSDVCEVVYLPRTPSVSTTGLIEHIAKIAPRPDRPDGGSRVRPRRGRAGGRAWCSASRGRGTAGRSSR